MDPVTALQTENTPPARRRRRIGLFCLRCVLIGLITVGFALGLSIYLNVKSEQDLEWLRQRLEDTLNMRAGGAFTVRLASAGLAIDERFGASVSLGGLDIIGTNERFTISGENIAIIPNWFSVFSDQIEIRALSFDRARVRLVMPAAAAVDAGVGGSDTISEIDQSLRQAEMSLIEIGRANRKTYAAAPGLLSPGTLSFDDFLNTPDFALEPDDDGANGDPEILTLLAKQLEKAGLIFDRLKQLRLSRVNFKNLSLSLVDAEERLIRELTIPLAEFYEKAEATAGAEPQRLRIMTEQRGAAGIQIDLSHLKDQVGGAKRAFLFHAGNVLPRNFVGKLNEPDFPVSVDVPFSASGQVVLGADAAIRQLDFSLFADRGTFATGPKATVLVDSAALHFTLNRQGRSLTIKPSPFSFEENRFRLEGELKLPQRIRDPYPFAITADDSLITAPDGRAEPLIVERALVRGAIQPIQKLVSVSSFQINAGDASFTASAAFGFDGETPSMALAAEASPMPVDTLKQLWPIFIAPIARGWTIENVLSGTVFGGKVVASVPNGVLGRLRKGATLDDTQLQVDFQISDATFKTFGDFPRISNASVRGSTSGITFTADVENGTAESALGNSIAVRKGQFHIADVRFPAPVAEIFLDAEGKAQDIGEIANRNPVRALRFLNLEPQALSGEAHAQVSVTVPLRGDVKTSEVDWKADIAVKNFASDTPIDGRKIEKADAEISVIPAKVSVKGRGRIDGIDANIDLVQSIDGISKAGSLAVTIDLSEDDRKRLGIDLEGFLSGPVGVAIDQKNGPGASGDTYKLDLARAEITIDALGWRKAAGVPAKASMRLKTDASGTSVRDFVLEGDGFSAAGDIDITQKGAIRRLDLKKLALRPTDSLAVRAELKSDGTYDVNVNGAAFDARSLINRLTATQSEGKPDVQRYRIEAAIGQVTGFGGEVISDLALSVTLRGGTPLLLSVGGKTDKASQPFSIAYGSRGGEGDVLSVSGPDGGGLARFMNIYQRAAGGQLTIAAKRPPGATAMQGTFRMRKFALIEEPALKSLTASRDSAGRHSVAFDVLDINFIEEGHRITTTRGLLTGDAVGGTYEGVFDRQSKAVDFTGTYVPAYVLNNLITKIPILGLALGNGQREGLIGVTFKVTGTFARPQVTVNPLSALAPGFLRKLFQFRKAQGQTN